LRHSRAYPCAQIDLAGEYRYRAVGADRKKAIDLIERDCFAKVLRGVRAARRPSTTVAEGKHDNERTGSF
jgi:hypothetical protein